MENDPIKRFESELLVTGYSKRTIKMYLLYATEFSKLLKKPVETALREDIITFLAKKQSEGASNTTLSFIWSALKAFLTNFLKLKCMEDVKRPKKGHYLPAVMTKAEVQSLFSACRTSFERAILELMYASGLRVSECINLKFEDIDFNEGIIQVRGGKGDKDRITVVSRKWLEKLNRLKLKEGYIFKGRQDGHISEDFVQKKTKTTTKK